MKYFSIYDIKAQVYGQLFPAFTLGAAERALKESMGDPNTPHAKFPEDFDLYFMCEFDEETGRIHSVNEPPQLVVRASQLVSG